MQTQKKTDQRKESYEAASQVTQVRQYSCSVLIKQIFFFRKSILPLKEIILCFIFFPKNRRNDFGRLWEKQTLMALIAVGCFGFFSVFGIHVSADALMDRGVFQREVIIILIIWKEKFQFSLLSLNFQASQLLVRRHRKDA